MTAVVLLGVFKFADTQKILQIYLEKFQIQNCRKTPEFCLQSY